MQIVGKSRLSMKPKLISFEMLVQLKLIELHSNSLGSARSGHSFTAEDYQQWKATQPPSTTTPSSSETTSDPPNQTDSKPSAPPHPASFDAIVELISTGRTDEIPGIKDIPLKVSISLILLPIALETALG